MVIGLVLFWTSPFVASAVTTNYDAGDRASSNILEALDTFYIFMLSITCQ